MSESEIISEIESSSTSKRMNAQTQHGSEATADEENIVLLATSFSPVRETSDEVVWHEDFENVSLNSFSKNISNFQLFLMGNLARRTFCSCLVWIVQQNQIFDMYEWKYFQIIYERFEITFHWTLATIKFKAKLHSIPVNKFKMSCHDWAMDIFIFHSSRWISRCLMFRNWVT